MNKLSRQALNRRNEDRLRCAINVKYLGDAGVEKKAQILNVTEGGARICCESGVNVGEQIILFRSSRSGLKRIVAEVRWTSDLPGGIRQMAGLKIIYSCLEPASLQMAA